MTSSFIMISQRIFSVATLLLVAASFAPADDVRRPVEFTDLNGKTHTPLSQANHKATILFFVLPDCPISNAYAMEIKRIATEYAKRDVISFIVYADPDLSADDAKEHAMKYGYQFPALQDKHLELVKQTGAKIAPEVVLLDQAGKRRYRGRIDDLYADLGKRRAQASQHDLRDALDAVLEGRAVLRETTKAIGCILVKP